MKPRRISDDISGDSSIMKTCCCCMDVRLGTIVLGFCHLVMSLFYLPFHFHVSMYSKLYEERYFETYGTAPRSADNSVALGIAFFSFIVTVLLIYGAITRQPSYLLPFFCLQVFDFCVNLLGAVGAISYIPELKLMLKNNAYFIGCVWSCYKILVNFRAKQATSDFLFQVHSDEKESQNLLPNYEDAVKDTPKESPPPYTSN
ncbi:Lysosomal-associated transmembrane protein 4A [Acropora cervicornis]|uniref:Lysosomal-associated transmembrane protein 4A n=1 Tax=Acropora cervicornis TaxID=6130 RepID=A0AAD9PVN7_ACRCE|nr:Lysosomal-associated transmembrane protein 4A [Acropora cervicornis]